MVSSMSNVDYDKLKNGLTDAIGKLDSFMDTCISEEEYKKLDKLSAKMKETFLEVMEAEKKKNDTYNYWIDTCGDIRELERLESTQAGRKALKKARKKHDLSMERFKKRSEDALEIYKDAEAERKKLHKKLERVSSESYYLVSTVLGRLKYLDEYISWTARLSSVIYGSFLDINEYNYEYFDLRKRIESGIKSIKEELEATLRCTIQDEKAEKAKAKAFEIIDIVYDARMELDKIKNRMNAIDMISEAIEGVYTNPNYSDFIELIKRSVDEYNEAVTRFYDKNKEYMHANGVISNYEDYTTYTLIPRLQKMSEKEREAEIAKTKKFYDNDYLKYVKAEKEMEDSRREKEEKKRIVKENIISLLQRIIDDCPKLDNSPLDITVIRILNIGEFAKIDAEDALNQIFNTIRSYLHKESNNLEEAAKEKRLVLFEQINAFSNSFSSEVAYIVLDYLNGDQIKKEDIRGKVLKKIDKRRQ